MPTGYTMTMITEYKAKVEAIRRYRAATGKRRASIARPENAPWQITLSSAASDDSFTLAGNELVGLLADFSDVASVQDLFTDQL